MPSPTAEASPQPDQPGQPGTNSLHIWDGFLLFASHEIVNTFHSHYAASIIFAAQPDSNSESLPIRIEDEDGQRETFRAVVIPPNFAHRLSAPGVELAVLMVDPDWPGFSLAVPLTRPRTLRLSVTETAQHTQTVRRLRSEKVRCTDALEFASALMASAGSGSPASSSQTPAAQAMDSRVSEVLEHIQAMEELPVDINAEEMARMVGLSGERFRALFKNAMGLRFRRYLLWLRLRRAAALVADGLSLTEIAHATGFSDSAHFSRTFREMLGHAPSDLLGKGRSLQIECC